MTTERITELLRPFFETTAISTQLAESISIYIDLLLKWNAKLNLTAIRNPDEIVSRHFGESLFAAGRLFPCAESSVRAIDIGSGAGFPGLPIKLWAPSIQMTLIESNQRKATFLREVVRALQLKDIQVLSVRAESVALRADLVTFRAVERFDDVLPIAARLSNPDGRVALLIGEGQAERAAALAPSINWQFPIAIPASRSRILLIGRN